MKRAIFAALVIFSASTALAETSILTGKATVYAGGFEVVETAWRVEKNVTTGAYVMDTSVDLKGILAWFFDFEATHRAEGRLVDGVLRPATFSLRGDLRGEARQSDIVFDETGPKEITVIPEDTPDERDPVPSDLLPGTVDPLALFVLSASRDTAEEVCTTPPPFFDGRRVVQMEITAQGWEELESSNSARFQGQAFKCLIDQTVLAGQYKGDYPGKGGPKPPTVLWIARPEGSVFWQPVRMERETPLGKLVAHLEDYSVENTNHSALRPTGQ